MILQSDTFVAIDTTIGAMYGNMSYGQAEFLGVPLFESTSLLNLVVRFAFNMLVSFLIVHCFYYPKSKRRDYYFTFLLFSATMFLLLFLMENVSMQIGFTLGLFAIFGMIRYRTETVPIREMTYLFIIIGASVINALAMTVSYAELLASNILLLALMWVLESPKVLKQTATKIILYDKIDLIVPEKRDEMMADLKARTGLEISNVEIGHIDFLRDVAYIKVHYYTNEKTYSSIEGITKYKAHE